MASKNLPTDVVVDDPNHVPHHNDAHEVVNLLDFDSLVAGSAGQVIKKQAGGLWAAGDDLTGGGGFGTDMGWRYVSWNNGNDGNDGLSPATAKKTIQSAHDSLPSTGIPTGGVIVLAGHQHDVGAGVNITKSGTLVWGAGRHSTEILITQNDGIGFKVAGERVGIQDLQISDRSNRATPSGIEARAGIWADNCQESVFQRLYINGIADTYTGSNGFGTITSGDISAVEPTAIIVSGVDAFSDWVHLDMIRTRNVHSGLKLQSASNGWVTRSVFGGERESVWIKRRNGATNQKACSWRFIENQLLGGGGGADDYSFRAETDLGSDAAGRVRLMGMHLEISAATGDTNGFYIDLDDVMFSDTHLGVGTMGSGKNGLRVGPNGRVTFGQYTSVGFDPATQVTVDGGGVLNMWRPADYSGP